jgi:hypothetical protein
MTRATLLYLGMLVLLGVGFEGIRRLGNTLTPPRHIGGLWRLTLPSSSTSCPILEFGAVAEGDLQVEQSGRYLSLTFPDVSRTLLRARFDGGRLHGSGPSTIPCAMGKWLHVYGRVHDSLLEIVLGRSSETPTPSVPALVFIATRPAGFDSHSPPSP